MGLLQKTMLFRQNLLMKLFGQLWATFYSNIWSHWRGAIFINPTVVKFASHRPHVLKVITLPLTAPQLCTMANHINDP